MISNQILQSTIEGLKEISRIDFCVIDLEGNVLAATFPESEEYRSSVVPFVDSPADSQVVQGHQFFKIYDELQVEYVLVAKGSRLHTKSDLTKITLSRICFWTTCFW